ncbi:MAG: DUF4911 domain-containing protein [Candidatus Magnetomorum sp.]|nr:DUF4911 domain-containing protein [Candidatus Magnetomorum sp.]
MTPKNPSQNDHLTTRKTWFRIHKNHICFVRFILEAYDGIALMRTLHPQKNIVEIMTAPGCETEVDTIIHDLSQTIPIIPMKREQ